MFPINGANVMVVDMVIGYVNGLKTNGVHEGMLRSLLLSRRTLSCIPSRHWRLVPV